MISIPPKKTMPTLPSKFPTAPANQNSTRSVALQAVTDSKQGHRICLYGPGGIGKTTLACKAPGPIAFIDADESLAKLKTQLVAADIKVPSLVPAPDFAQMRLQLQSSGWDGIKTIVVDTMTPVEQWATAQMLATTRNDKNLLCSKIEDFGYGKGYRFLYDVFLPLLADLDRHARAGRNVILVAHDDVKTVPNPAGLDWIRWEPKMMDAKGCSIRARVKEWADHVLFYSYDIEVDDQGNKKARSGKGKGSGTRCIYTAELPFFMAKSRSTSDQIVVDDSIDVWSQIIK